jgi:flagellar FliL protein
MKNIIFIAVGAILIIAISVGTSVVVTGMMSEPPAAAAMEEAEVEEVDSDDIYYYSVQPEFVVNYGKNARPRVLMMEMSVASDQESTADLLDRHGPELRNNVLILLAEQKGAGLETSEGKNSLREDIKASIEAMLVRHGSDARVTDIFLTRFVTQ